jgi:hypothetical protein
MRREEPAPENIRRRAITLWQDILRGPKYDNGDKSAMGGLGMALAFQLASKHTPTEEQIAAFGEALFTALSTPDEYGVYPYGLHVDYHPDRVLGDAADAAGINPSRFSIKTGMWINHGFVSISEGYGAESVNHYPLEDGRWLVTTLSGSDIDKVKEYVLGGAPTFTVKA